METTIIAAAPAMLDALRTAEEFIAGFEGDEMQEGVDDMLQAMRAAIVAADPAGEAASAARFRNSYYCEDCGTAWQDESAHVCDDRCPACNTSCSPSESDDI